MKSFIDEHITRIFLGLFMYVSGLFISKYTFYDFCKDVKLFYMKRFKRFYILYSFSVIFLFIIHFNPGVSLLVTSLLGISTYFQPQPRTLWFMSMLMSFYLLTPFVKSNKSIIAQVSVVLLIFLLAILYYIYFPNRIDVRFFWCFPLYSLGLLFPQIQVIVNNHFLGIFMFLFTCFLVFLLKENIYYKMAQLLIIPMGIFSCFYCCKLLMIYLPRINSFVRVLAYCSMSAYLFHREIYYLLGCVFRFFLPYMDLHMFAVIMIVFPICILFSYLIQYVYDNYFISYLN